MSSLPHSRCVPDVIHQHVEESAVLRDVRSRLVAAPHVRLRHLRRLDDRLAAHLDALATSKDVGRKLCDAALERPGVGEVFAATVGAIEDKDLRRLEKMLALVEAMPASRPGLLSAFGWVSSQHLQGTIKTLLASDNAFRRCVGISACTMHRVDPGAALDQSLNDSDAALRAHALRVAGECARRELLSACVSALADADAACRLPAACSAALLGDRNRSIAALKAIASQPGPARFRALRVLLKLVEAADALDVLKTLAQDPSNTRLVITGAGVAGDPHYVPWLIKQMEDPKLARLAGESFSFMTGLDLAYLDLDRRRPEDFESDPKDEPRDDDVAMDEDEGLPWPDPVKIHAWWRDNKSQYAVGARYFMGETVNWQSCLRVLREGFQRQRVAAAQYLCLVRPGTVLFNCAAPAWRQQRWLNSLN